MLGNTLERKGTPVAELRDKTELLEASYKEVLDATKHQDDKIGRLLTAIAFLTAAALALANLGSGRYIRAEFDFGASSYKLGMLALAVFLICVFLSVVLLVTSFATPLRLPGLKSPETGTAPAVKWVNGVKGSQIYFSEIAALSLDKWEKKWSGTKLQLEEERAQSLLLETHNLSVRTNFKYLRTSEGISVFAIAMLGFGLAVLFITLAVTGEPDTATAGDRVTLTVGPTLRLWVSLITIGYVALHLFSRIRYNYQATYEGYRRGGGVGELLYAAGQFAVLLTASTYIGVLLLNPPQEDVSPCWLALLALGGLFALATSQLCRPGDESKAYVRAIKVLVGTVVGAVALVGAAAATSGDNYAPQFWSGLAFGFGLLSLSVLQPTLSDWSSRLRRAKT